MAVELYGGVCPRCGQSIASGAGPNWMKIPTPVPGDWLAIAALCPSPKCKAVLGTYATPNVSIHAALDEKVGGLQRTLRSIGQMIEQVVRLLGRTPQG